MKNYMPIKQIKKDLKLIKATIGRSPILSILECVLFKDKAMHATRLSVEISIPFEFDGEPIVIDFKSLFKLFSNFKKGAFAFSVEKVDEDNFLVIESQDGLKVKMISSDNFEDFPVIEIKNPTIAENMCFSADYTKTIVSCIDFVANDYLRPAMCGVLCEDGFVTATDSHCLINRKTDAVKLPLKWNSEYSGILLDREILPLLKLKQEAFTLKSTKENFTMTFEDGVKIYFRFQYCLFPTYKAVIPPLDGYKISISVKTIELIECLKIGSFALPTSKEVWINAENGKLKILISDDYGSKFEYQNEVNAETIGEMKVLFRYDLLMRCLKQSGEIAVFHFEKENKPVRINEDILLMPTMAGN